MSKMKKELYTVEIKMGVGWGGEKELKQRQRESKNGAPGRNSGGREGRHGSSGGRWSRRQWW